MPITLIYLLKSVICTGIFVLYYWFALRNKRFHYYNRFYLLTAVTASIILPFLQFSWFDMESSNPKLLALLHTLYARGNLPAVTVSNSPVVDIYGRVLAVIVLLSGLFLLLLCSRVIAVIRLKRRYRSVKMEYFNLIDTDLDKAPFAFLNDLFWRRDIDLHEGTGRQILEHELTHIQQKHTWDKLYMQALTAVFWMNPFFWIVERELSMIHEFIADEKAIGDHDASAFAAMILKAQYGRGMLSPVNCFARSPIKRRLRMLTSQGRPQFSYFRRLMFLPLLGGLVLLFAFRVHEKKQASLYQVLTGLSMAPSFGADSAFVIMPDAVKAVLAVKPKIQLRAIPDTIAYRYGKYPVSYTGPGRYIPTNGLYGLVDRVKLEKNKDASPVPVSGKVVIPGQGETPLIIVDGIQVDDISGLSPTDIEGIKVLKGKTAEELYKQKGASGVVLITTKSGKGLKKTTSPDSGKSLYYFEPAVRAGRHSKTPQKWVYGKEVTKSEARFPGGVEAWKHYLIRNIRADVPTENGAHNGSYTVVVSFNVNKNGEVSAVKAENNPGFGTAEEAERVIKNGPRWLPAEVNGHKITYRQRQQITFQIVSAS